MLSVVVSILLLVMAAFGQLTSDVDRLMTDLFDQSSYNKLLRPVINASTITKVHVSFSIYSINYVDVTSAKIEVNGAFAISWKDEFLVWNKTKYDGIDSLSLPPGFLWVPEIAISKGVINEARLLEKTDFSPIWVTSTGEVYMIPAGQITTMCKVDTSLFPFDSHECSFTLISARYDNKELALVANQDGIDLSQFNENPEWVATNSTTEELFEISTGNRSVPYIVKQLKIERRPAFVIIHILVPEFLISCLNLATCYVPFDSGERLSFAITIFMSFVFLSGTIVQELPRNSVVISFTSFTILCINLMNVLLVIWSIAVVRVSRRSDSECKKPLYVIRLLSKSKKEIPSVKCEVVNEACNDEECNRLPKPKVQDYINDIHVVTWYQFAELLDKVHFVILLSLTAIIYIVEFIILKINNVV